MRIRIGVGEHSYFHLSNDPQTSSFITSIFLHFWFAGGWHLLRDLRENERRKVQLYATFQHTCTPFSPFALVSTCVPLWQYATKATFITGWEDCVVWGLPLLWSASERLRGLSPLMEHTPRGSSLISDGGEFVPKDLPAVDIFSVCCLWFISRWRGFLEEKAYFVKSGCLVSVLGQILGDLEERRSVILLAVLVWRHEWLSVPICPKGFGG